MIGGYPVNGIFRQIGGWREVDILEADKGMGRVQPWPVTMWPWLAGGLLMEVMVTGPEGCKGWLAGA